MVYVWILGGLVLGVAIGIISPFDVPVSYAKYTSVALLAALDSVFGGTRAAIERTFQLSTFITGFFSNSLLAAVLVFLGNAVGIDLYYAVGIDLYYVALISFGLRLFQNTAAIRRLLLTKRLHT